MNIIVYGEPIAKGSMKAYNTAKGIRVVNDSEKTESWQTLIAYAAGQKCKEVADGPVALNVSFYLPRGKTVKRAYPSTIPDIDKLLRTVLDALTKIAYMDDGQVVDVQVSKRYADGEGDFARPRVEIIIQGVEK